MAQPRDPYKYFRIEGRELLEGLSQGIIKLEQDSATQERVSHLLRLAHTLKGAARVVKCTDISELSHSIEDILTTFRDGKRKVTSLDINKLLGLVDQINVNLKKLDLRPENQSPENQSKEEEKVSIRSSPSSLFHEDEVEIVRVDVSEMDSILYGLSQASIRLGTLRSEFQTYSHMRKRAGVLIHSPLATDVRQSGLNRHEELGVLLDQAQHSLAAGLEKTEQEIERIREQANALRLIPAQGFFGLLERTCRDAAESLKKNVHFSSTGGDVRLDAHILRSIRDALVQLVRNAIAHGIETPDERRVAGKPDGGQVRLAVERRGSRVAFICCDDGRGIDVEAIRKVAATKGLIAASEVQLLDEASAIQMLLKGGLSTSKTIDEVSGRGVGLDLVREIVSKLNGQILIQTKKSRGMSIEIEVPISLESFSVLTVEASQVNISLPLACVLQSFRLSAKEIASSPEGESIFFMGKPISFMPLAKLLKQKSTSASAEIWMVIIVQDKGVRVALGVDRIVGTSNIVMRPLPSILDEVSLVAGCSIDGKGNPQIVLDSAAVVHVVPLNRSSTVTLKSVSKPRVLVIDDSLTTRMLEKSILETAGYEVDLATSAEEGFAMATINAKAGKTDLYTVFIVDVEMPGMNGFEFVERIRNDALLSKVPAILVTSLSSPEDRMKAEKAGVNAYIVKGEFDEGYFLKTVRALGSNP